MKKVADAVRELVFGSEMAQEALRRGCLNYHAYAKDIKAQVEALAWKPVTLGSIVVALSRLQPVMAQAASLKPQLRLLDLNITLPLADITYEKNQQTTRATQLLYSLVDVQSEYFMVTYGASEITLVCSESLVPTVKEHFRTSPLAELYKLVGVTVTFDPRYLQQPNVIYSILSSLAVKKINILEIISTSTSLTMVIEETELNTAVAQLKLFFGTTPSKTT